MDKYTKDSLTFALFIASWFNFVFKVAQIVVILLWETEIAQTCHWSHIDLQTLVVHTCPGCLAGKWSTQHLLGNTKVAPSVGGLYFLKGLHRRSCMGQRHCLTHSRLCGGLLDFLKVHVTVLSGHCSAQGKQTFGVKMRMRMRSRRVWKRKMRWRRRNKKRRGRRRGRWRKTV